MYVLESLSSVIVCSFDKWMCVDTNTYPTLDKLIRIVDLPVTRDTTYKMKMFSHKKISLVVSSYLDISHIFAKRF